MLKSTSEKCTGLHDRVVESLYIYRLFNVNKKKWRLALYENHDGQILFDQGRATAGHAADVEQRRSEHVQVSQGLASCQPAGRY